jgi:ligand-binding sensor domain-containing protein
LFHEESKSFEHFRYKAGDPGSLTTDVVLTINEDPDGNLLLGTYSGGLMVFNPDTKKVIRAYSATTGLGADDIGYIHKDSKGRYWLAVLSSGYSLYDPLTGTFQNYTTTSELIPSCSSSIMNITEDSSGKYGWVQKMRVFAFWIMTGRKLRITGDDENNKNSLSYNDIKSIVFLDNMLIATNGGLNRLDMRTDSFKVYTMDEGLSSNALMCIQKDKYNNL